EELRSEVDKALEELQALPERREIDIAADFNGDPAFIHKESVFSGKKGEGAWTMSLQIYCRQERCPRCPHGWFNYRYRRNRKTGNVRIEWTGGSPTIDPDVMKELRKGVAPPQAAYAYEIIEDGEKARPRYGRDTKTKR